MLSYTPAEFVKLEKMLEKAAALEYRWNVYEVFYRYEDVYDVFDYTYLKLRTPVDIYQKLSVRRARVVPFLYLDLRDAIFNKPLTDMPLLIDDPFLGVVARWRFMIGR